MSESELSRYYWLKKEIKDIEDRIEEFGTGLSAGKYTESIKGIGGKNTTIQDRYAELREMYIEKRIMALEEYIKIETYISTVEEPKIRLIMRRRFLDLKDWEAIGNEMNYDRTSVSKMLREYLKHSHNSHK